MFCLVIMTSSASLNSSSVEVFSPSGLTSGFMLWSNLIFASALLTIMLKFAVSTRELFFFLYISLSYSSYLPIFKGANLLVDLCDSRCVCSSLGSLLTLERLAKLLDAVILGTVFCVWCDDRFAALLFLAALHSFRVSPSRSHCEIVSDSTETRKNNRKTHALMLFCVSIRRRWLPQTQHELQEYEKMLGSPSDDHSSAIAADASSPLLRA